MKLHLPKSLRTALLSCLAAISPWSLTLATGAISVGAVVFSLGAQAQAETISITADTKWNATTNHSADVTTVSGSGTDLMVRNANGDGHAGMSAGATLELGDLTMESGTNLNLWAWTSTVKTVSTTDKVIVNGSITLDNAELSIQDGSYYFNETLNVVGESKVYTQYAKGLVFDSLSGDENAVLTFHKGPNDNAAALFTIGGSNAEASSDFKGTIKLLGNSSARTADLAINDAEALRNAAVSMDGNSKMVIMLQQVMAEAVYGNGMIVKATDAVTGHATPVLQITGNATESQAFSGTMASNITWQIGDGTTAASSRFAGATLNGTLDIKAGSTAYLTGDNTFGTLTNNGTLHLSEGSSFVITSQAAYQGAVLTLGTVTGLSGNTFSYGNGWLATYDSATGTATITDNSSIYWIDNGVDGNTLWSAAENWQGGVLPTANDKVRLGSDGAGRIVSFDGDATVGEVRVVAGDYGFVVSGNSTLTGTVYVAPVGATLTKSGAGTLTLTNATANALSVTEGELVVNTLSLAHGSSFTKNGVGTMKLGNVSGILGKNVTVDAGELHITQTGDSDVAKHTVYTVTVEAGATLNDDRRLRLTGGSLTVTGGGIYELEGICLSGTGGNVTSLKVEADTVLHITGTTQHADGDKGSFMLSNWPAGNSINIEGLLVSDAGISNRDGTGVINIDNGGALQLNAGMSRTTHSDKKTTINVKNGASLIVNGTNTDGTQHITTSLSDGSTVFTTSGATIANNMTYAGTVKLGAAADAELSLTAASPSFTNLIIMGSADKVSALDARTVKEYAAGGTVKFTNAVSGTSITLNAGAQFEATAGLTLTGALTLGANAEATLGGAVSIASLAGKNAGELAFASNLSSLTLQDFVFGQEYAIGNVANGSELDWCGLLGYDSTLQTISYENGVLRSSYKDALWSSPADSDITWGGADNWTIGTSNVVLNGSENVILGVIDTTAEQPVSSVIQIAANTTVAGVTVRDAYSLSVAEGTEFSFDSTTITFEEGGSLSKVGQGALSMSLADAKAAKMNIAEGTLAISDDLGGYSAGNSSAQTAHDLTAVSGSGTLAVKLFGEETTNGRSLVSLSDSFTGTLEVCAGALDRNSLLGGTSAIKLNNGGLFGRETAGGGTHDFACDIIVEGNSWLSGQGGTGKDDSGYYVNLTGDITGDGVLSIKGLCDWHFKGDMSGFTGSIKLVTGGEEADWVIFHSAASFDTLTIATGNVEVDAALTVKSVNQTGGSLTINDNASLEITGSATLKTITNRGTLKLQSADSLTLVGFNDAATTVDGTQTFTLGTVENATEVAWNKLTGVSIGERRVKYSGGTVSYEGADATYIVWADTEDEEYAWGEDSNWRWADDRSLAATPTSANKVQLTADAANKSISMSGSASVGELNVQGAYDLDVAAGAAATLTATTITVGEGGKLSKTGEGTLTMSMANAVAGKLHISEGALKLSDSLSHTLNQSTSGKINYDLTAITSSASGILEIDCNGSWQGTGLDATAVALSNDFTGILSVVNGQLLVKLGNDDTDGKTVFGGASAIRLNTGALFFVADSEVNVDNIYVGNGGGGFTNRSALSTISSDISGDGNLFVQGDGAAKTLKVTGGVNLDGQFKLVSSTFTLESATKAQFNGGFLVNGGVVNINSAADISELSVTGGTFNINGAEVNIASLKSGSLTLTGAADLTAVLADAAQVMLTGAATADATLSVVTGGSATLSVAESLNSLTVTEGGALALTGALTLGDLYNTGSLDITNLSSLTLGGLALVDGAEYEVGTLTGTDSKDWNALLGLDGSLTAAYDGNKIVLSLSGTPVLWVGDAESTWDEVGEDGASTAWQQGSAAFTPGSKSAVVLGNAASLGELNDAVTRTIVLDADTVVGSVTVQDAYSFSVAEGETYSFDANSIVLDGGSLSKTGAGTLSMSLEDAVAAKLNIAGGTLSISGTLADTSPSEVSPIDMSALGGVGTLSITAAGVNGGTSDGTRTNVVLGDGFTGTLQVSGGQLDADSTTGGASLVVLDGATLTDTHGDGVHTVAWNIKVSDNDAYLRHFGHAGQDNRDSYATRLTGTLTGSADAMLKVIDSGEWFLAGDMSGYQGGLSIEGNTNYVTFESSATLASLSAVGGSRIFVDNGATLNTATTAVSDTVTTGATEGATLNMGAVTVNENGTLKIEGAGTHTLSTLAMGNNATLELGANTYASITTATEGNTYDGHQSNLTGVRELLIDKHVDIKVGNGAVLTDAGAWEISGGSDMTVSGGGVYHVAAIALGAYCKENLESSTLTIGENTTLHITGTNTTGSKFGDAFSLGHWNVDNSVNVLGVLELECGISSYSGYSNTATITVENGGKIAFNNGLHAAGKDNAGVIKIKGGGVLEVSGTNVTGTNLVTVIVENDAKIFGGTANGATESVIANDMVIKHGFYVGAAAGTTLTLAPESGSFNFENTSSWVDVLGTDSGHGGKVVFDVDTLQLNALKVYSGAQAAITSDARLYFNQYGGIVVNQGATLSFDGAGEITLGQAIKNAGTVEILNAADTQFVLSNALLEEQVGVSKTWTLVNNTGTITGWDELGLGNFLLDGSALQQGDWDGYSITDGKVMLYMLSRYWDATGDAGVWNTGADANWREFENSTETVTFESNSRVTFTDTDETGAALDKSVTVADGGVHAKSVTITGSDYVFRGGKVLVNQSLSLSAQQNARFDSAVVIGSSAPLQLDVAAGATLTLSTLETVSTQSYGGVSYGSGAFSKTGEGTLLITDAINGTITGATVSGGKLQLGVAGTEEAAARSIVLTVGANTLTTAGGTLENVVLAASGTVVDGVSGATVGANNLIASADGENYAVLTDVALNAGSASGYATLKDVSFAGNSSLQGYITFEHTKKATGMAVAADSTLTIGDLTLDLHGLSSGDKQIIVNDGTIKGWQGVNLVYSGVVVNSAAADLSTDGWVKINTSVTNTDANLYWDGLVAGAAESDAPVASSAWDKSSANWSDEAGTDKDCAFLSLSNTYFGATPEGGSKTVNAAQDMVMSNMFVTEGGYSFTGSRLATLGNMHITPASGEVSFANDLVAQGNVTLSAAQGGSLSFAGMLQVGGTITANVAGALRFDNAVSAGGKVELNAQNLEVNGALRSAGDVSISSGTRTAGGAGSLTIGESGSITGANVTINVNAGAESDTHYRDYVVESAGNITATAEGGKVCFTGNGAAHITGTVTADEIVVDTQSSNGIIFRQLDTDTLTITEGSYAALTDETSTGQQETSRIGTIQLGGRLGLTQFAGTYSGYNLVTTSATATVDFATIAKVTFASVKGEQLADGTYGSIVFNDSYRELTVNKLETVNNITFGAGEYWAKLNNASGAIHGNLTVRGGGGLYVSSDNIMANGKGAWYIGGPLYLQGTTQTLAGNAVYLDGAVISGTHASGMNYTADSQIHYTGNNTISANMTVAEGTYLTIEAGNVPEDIQAEQADILTLNGNLQGGGVVQLTGSGRVSLGAANAFTGTMTVQNHTQLSLDNTQALASANLVLNPNGVLIVDRSAVETPFTIGALTLGGGALQINNLMAMDAVSAKDAALKLGALITRMTNTLDLTLSFTSGELQTMKTYNLFTADASHSLAGIANLLNLDLRVVNGTETLDIADNQYKLVYDADSNVIAIRTMLGNIWDGGADGDGDGIWSTDNTHKNWSDSDYDQATAFNDAIFADLTGEGIGENAVVTIQGTVNPGDVYFEADTTDYVLNATDTGAMLGAGNVIHKAGAADVTLNLANNGTVETALGGMDLQAGNTTLAANVAVAGEVSVAAGATLQTGANTLLMVGGNGEAYTAKGTYSGLTMDATGIAGVADALGVVTNGIINGAAELNYLNLSGKGSLDDVTIGSGLNVAAGSDYTLNGRITFLDTLQNTGTVLIGTGTTVELGGLAYALSADGGSSIYQLIHGGTISGMDGITEASVYLNGVSLANGENSGLASGIATVMSSSDGTVTISIGKVLEGGGVDGSIAVTSWDARWGKDGKAPALAKRFGGATNMFFNTDTGYLYTHIVSAGNATAVNAGKALVVSIDAGATAPVVAAGNSSTYSDHEVWIYDHSAVDTVVGGRYYASTTEPTGSYNQNADTHLYINTADAALADQKSWVVGGSWNAAHSKDSYVTVQNGNILTLVGGSYGANQDGSTHVYVDGGTIAEVFAGGFNVYENAGYYGDVASSNLTITGGTLGLTTEAVNKRVYGGSYYGTVHGDVNVTVEGDATITKLVGGGYHGSVDGNITINLLSGTVTERVDAAGVGDSSVTGDVLVNLTQGFNVTGGLYGGKQSDSGVTLNGSSTLAFVSAGETYDLSAIAVQGFDTFTLADGTHVKVSTQSGFATDTASGVLTISGLGKVELVGNTDLGRDITLTDGATLWFNSDYAGNAIGTQDSRRVLTATAGTTIEITGQPTNGDGLCVWLDLTGHGADGNGALYKALVGAETTPAGKVALPKVTLSDSASVNAEDNIYFIECKNSESELILKGNTLTKVGEADLVLYNSTVTDTSANDTDTGVDGTIFVKEGTLGTGYGMRAAKTNIVLSSGSELNIIDIGEADTNIGALSGSGSVALNKGLVITTSSAGSYGKGSDWMTEGADAYSQFSADSGFAYGVYSGTISGSNSLSVKGDAVQYLSGSESTFSGGVHMYDSATLYLMSGTSGSAVQGNSTVTAGVVGTGAIAWDSPDAKLYLGNGVQVYNAGTTNVANANMIIGVEAAPHGDALSNYVGVNSKGADGVLYITVGGKEYVEIDTHNLQSITCDGMYADGTAYVAGTEIDRNKMLLVEKSVWELNTATVAGFSAGGYNTATYSGVLSGNANLVKVGLGTLILDQTNTYTGKTIISEGSLVLKGWAQIGGSADSAALNVEQAAGSTLMLAYDGTYDGEITEITNDIAISGTGDERWTTEAATNETTAALISSVSGQTPFTLSGDISGGGNLLHCGSGTLVLSGDSSFTGGTHATRGVVEVQSATGLGAGKVNIDSTADLHVTVEEGTTASRVATTLATAGTTVQGDVVISGTESTERILNVATGGYDNSSTTLHDNGTLLVNGAGVAASTGTLSGTGTVAVSDATGSGAKVDVHQMTAYTGDFVVEGNNASITVENGNYSGGSISVSGNDAVLSTKGDITITNGESLSLSSRGNAGAENDAAYVTTTGSVSVASGATLSVSDAATSYEYNLQNLQAAASLNGAADLVSGATTQTLVDIANIQNTEHVYKGAFNTDGAMNQKAAGAVDAKGGLTMASGATYETAMANTSLMGGSLTLESGLTLSTTLDLGQSAIDGAGRTTQLVLFSDVSGVNFVLDDINAVAKSGIYYTKAENYISGSYIDEDTWLVYDSGAGVVYLDGIVPEPTTATLSLLALAALAARRRRR